MTLITSSKGITKDIDLDIATICEYEEQHPDWSITDLFKRMEHLRFTDLNLMARCLGFADYADYVEQGYSLEDMMAVVEGSKYLGFTDSPGTEE